MSDEGGGHIGLQSVQQAYEIHCGHAPGRTWKRLK